MAISIVLIGIIIIVLLAIGIFCFAFNLHFKNKRLSGGTDTTDTVSPNLTRGEAFSIQQRQISSRIIANTITSTPRVNLRGIRMMEEQEIPRIQEPAAARIHTQQNSSTINRRLSIGNHAPLNNDIEPRSPPPPLPPRNSTILQRNTTTLVTYNNHDDDEIFQLPPTELSPVLARNSLLRSSQFVHLPSGFLNLGLSSSQFMIGGGNRFDLIPWLQSHTNLHTPNSLNFLQNVPSGRNTPFTMEDDLPPSYDEAIKMKATEASVNECENTRL